MFSRHTVTGMIAGVTSLTGLPGLAHADDAAPVADALLPIVVTARQRREDLEQVPVAITVVSGGQLDRAYIVNTQGLTTQVASLNYSSANPRNTSFTIRGLGSSVVAVSQANDGLEPGVGFYVDGVYHGRPATAAFDFSDIDRIEVLRGPQGTLFGKNTTAGAISIISQAPSFTPGAEEEISVGKERFAQVKAAATGPLIGDVLAYRISGVVTRRDGVIRNVNTGDYDNGIGNQAVRGQLLFTPSPSFKLRLIADFTNFQSECCTQVYLRVGTSLRPAAKQYPALAAGLGYAPPSTNPYDRLTDIDAPLGVSTNEGGVSATADWNIGPATVTSISAWRFWNWDAANDRDYTGVPIQLTQHIPSRQDQYSQELRIASNGQHKLTWVGGLYFFRQIIDGEPISIYGPSAAYWLLGPTFTSGTAPNATTVAVPSNLLDGYGTDGQTHFASSSYAAFGEANYAVTSRLIATVGLRYTYETKHGSYDSPVFGGPVLTGTPAQIAALTAAQRSILRRQTYSASNDDGSLSGRANVSYRFTDGVFGYASYARGYKSGGINMSGLPLDSTNNPVLATAVVKPERNTTYEVGLKNRLLGGLAVINLAGYWTIVHNFQATIVDNSQTVALRGYLSNIPETTVKGIEADAALHPLKGLTITGSFAYAHGEYTDYPKGPCPLELQGTATTICNFTGKPLVGLPRWTETLAGDYEVPVGSGAVMFHADTSWRTSYYGDPTLSEYTLIGGYNLTNASVGYRFSSGFEVAVFARNLLNANYIQNLTVQAGNSGLILGTPSDPRMIGITMRARQ